MKLTLTRIIGALAGSIVLFGVLAWWYGARTWPWAVEVVQTVFIGLGTLSIFLVWSQSKAATEQAKAATEQSRLAVKQAKENALWKRVLCFHEFFHNVPSPERARGMRELLGGVGIINPPSAYGPLTEEVVDKIWKHTGPSGELAVGKTIVVNYLNGFEQFCCAVLAGVVDENYARELRGTRVIDAYFGYRAFIERLRREQEEEAARLQPGNGPRPFKSKIFIELQRLAIQWHEKRAEELEKQAREVRESDARTQELRRKWLDLQGVPGILKGDDAAIDRPGI